MSEIVDARTDRDDAVAAAAGALRAGELAVLPTDTVYGVAADAFQPSATARVFAAKRRQRRYPLPVLVRSPKQLAGLVTEVDAAVEALMAAYWPGPLTIVVRADPNLAWDLGRNEGTVAVRMPMDDLILDVIRAVGPLAVTSANLSGQSPATTAQLARTQLGDAVEVYVDDGRRSLTEPSTIVDLTRREPAILRSGPLDDDEVLAVARGELEPHEASQPSVSASTDEPADKPISTGGPADTTPAEKPSVDEESAGAAAATTGAAATPHRAVDHRAVDHRAPRRDDDEPADAQDVTPEVDEPVADEPAADEPVADEPAADEPAPGEPLFADAPREPEAVPDGDGAEAVPADEPDEPEDEAAPDDEATPTRPRTRHIARDHRAG